jgi:hypothetical protein
MSCHAWGPLVPTTGGGESVGLWELLDGQDEIGVPGHRVEGLSQMVRHQSQRLIMVKIIVRRVLYGSGLWSVREIRREPGRFFVGLEEPDPAILEIFNEPMVVGGVHLARPHNLRSVDIGFVVNPL